MNAPTRLLTIVALVAICTGCNHRDSPFPMAWQPSELPGPTRPAVRSLTFLPDRVMAGGAAWGVVELAYPAPSGGLTVSLASNDLTVPSSVTVPAGSTTADFACISRESTGKAAATMTAVSPYGTPVTGILEFRPTVPSLLVSLYRSDGHWSSSNEIGSTTAGALIAGSCTSNWVKVGFRLPRYDWRRAEFAAAGLAAGSTGSSFSIYNDRITAGRYIVGAFDCSPSGQVRHFSVTFQRTRWWDDPRDGSYGEIHVTNASTEWPPYFPY